MVQDMLLGSSSREMVSKGFALLLRVVICAASMRCFYALLLRVAFQMMIWGLVDR